jgi:hypothetical protein
VNSTFVGHCHRYFDYRSQCCLELIKMRMTMLASLLVDRLREAISMKCLVHPKHSICAILACPAASIANTGGLQSSSTGGTQQILTCTTGTFPSGFTSERFLCNAATGQWSPNPATTVCGSGTGMGKDL